MRLLANYCELGFSPDLFWRITPREMMAHVQGAVRRARRERNEAIALAWNTATLMRVKKMPRLKRLLVDDEPKEPSKKQSWKVQLDIMRIWQEHMRRGNG